LLGPAELVVVVGQRPRRYVHRRRAEAVERIAGGDRQHPSDHHHPSAESAAHAASSHIVRECAPSCKKSRPRLQSRERCDSAAAAFADFAGDVLVLYGDVPLIRPATLRALLDAHRAAGADLTLVTLHFARPAGYGRIIRGPDSQVTGIVEERDASDVQRAITE